MDDVVRNKLRKYDKISDSIWIDKLQNNEYRLVIETDDDQKRLLALNKGAGGLLFNLVPHEIYQHNTKSLMSY